MNRLFLILAVAMFCFSFRNAQIDSISINMAGCVDSNRVILPIQPEISGAGVNDGTALQGCYWEAHLINQNKQVIAFFRSDRFLFTQETFSHNAAPLDYHMMEVQNSEFQEVNDESIILHPGDYTWDILLIQRTTHERILYNTKQSVHVEGEHVEPKHNNKKIVAPGLGHGQLDYVLRTTNQVMYGERRPLNYQYLVLRNSFEVFGIPLNSQVTMTNGIWEFQQQNPMVLALSIDTEALSRMREKQKNEIQSNAMMKKESLLLKKDSLINLLNGLNHTLDQPSFSKQLERLKALDSLDGLLLKNGSELDSLQLDTLMKKRFELKDSIPNEKYLREASKVKAQAQELLDKYQQVLQLQDSISNQQLPNQDSLIDQNKERAHSKWKEALSKVDDFGVGTVFYSINKYSIDGIPVNGGKLGIEHNEINYSVVAGKIARRTAPLMEHDQQENTWMLLGGVKKKWKKSALALHYLYLWEVADTGKSVLKRNHVVPIQYSIELGRLSLETEVVASHLVDYGNTFIILNQYNEIASDSGNATMVSSLFEQFGFAGKQNMHFSLNGHLKLYYAFEYISESFNSLAQPYLMTGLMNNELLVQANYWKKKLLLKVGAVHTSRKQENQRYSKIQPKAQLMCRIPGLPNLVINYLPTFIKSGNASYSSGLLNILSNYEHKLSQILISESAQYSQMILLNENQLTKMTQQIISMQVASKVWQAKLSYCFQNSSGNQQENLSNQFVQSDLVYKMLPWLELNGQGQLNLQGNAKKGYGIGANVKSEHLLFGVNYQKELLSLYNPTQAYYTMSNIYSLTLKMSLIW